MQTIRVLVLSVLMIVLCAFGYLKYLGAFQNVEVSEATFGPAQLMYTLHRGPYRTLGKAWEEFQKKWEEAGFQSCDGLAIYLDPPGTPENQLRSILACRMEQLDSTSQAKAAELFSTYSLPKTPVIHSRFPFKNRFSYMLGPIKVYPKLKEYADAHSFSPIIGIEVYGSTAEEMSEIQFLMPTTLTKSCCRSEGCASYSE